MKMAVIDSCGKCPHFYHPQGADYRGTCMHDTYGAATPDRPMGMLSPKDMPSDCPLPAKENQTT